MPNGGKIPKEIIDLKVPLVQLRCLEIELIGENGACHYWRTGKM